MPESRLVPPSLTLVATIVLTLLAAGCGAPKRYEPSTRYAEYEAAPMSEPSGSARARKLTPKKKSLAAPPPAPPPAAPMRVGDEALYADEPAPEPTPDQGEPSRMIHYDGYARIRTPRGEALVDKVIELAKAVGGEVEARSLVRVTVRIPVDRFDETWSQILDLGPVVQRDLGAEDVTDAFTDLDLRLQSLRATRDRLSALLAKTAELEERMALLRELHRLTEQIEVMEAQLRTLSDLAAMSRITVEAVAPDLHANASRALPYGMEWIDRLSAFDHHMIFEGRPVRLDVPEGFVSLEAHRYHVQAADGAVAWAFALENDPRGSAGFWRDAVIDRIGDQLSDGTTTQVGGWSLVRFEEPGAKAPYVWHLGFRVEGRKLQVFQVTYPDEAQEQRYHDAVLSVLKGGEA